MKKAAKIKKILVALAIKLLITIPTLIVIVITKILLTTQFP